MKAIVTKFLIICALSACVTKMDSMKKDKDIVLDSDEGYLLMSINTNINLTKLYINGEKNIRLTPADLKAGSNYILLPLPEGEYEFRRIFIREFYFDLSDDDELWKFSVKKNTISYIGELKIKTKGLFIFHSKLKNTSGTFELFNKSSSALEYLEQSFPNILKSRRIIYSGPGEDDFFDVVSSKIREKI